jgi:hypothetical protein
MVPSYPRFLARDEVRRALWLHFDVGINKTPSLLKSCGVKKPMNWGYVYGKTGRE